MNSVSHDSPRVKEVTIAITSIPATATYFPYQPSGLVERIATSER